MKTMLTFYSFEIDFYWSYYFTIAFGKLVNNYEFQNGVENYATIFVSNMEKNKGDTTKLCIKL